MSWEGRTRCRCCYASENLGPINSPALDLYLFICNSQNLESGIDEIVTCIRCHEFLNELNRFKIKCRAINEIFQNNLDVKPYDIESILRNVIDGSSSQIELNTAVTEETDEIDQIDIHINKVEEDFDSNDFPPSIIESIDNQVCDTITPTEEEPAIEENNTNNCGPEEPIQKNTTKRKTIRERSPCVIIDSTSGKRFKKADSIETLQECDNCAFKCKEKDHMIAHQIIHDKTKCIVIVNRYEENVQENYENPEEAPLETNNMTDIAQPCNSSIGTNDKIIDKIKLFSCDLCSFITTQKHLLINHMQNNIHIIKELYACDYCNYQTNTKINISRHIQQHLKQKKLVKHTKGSFKAISRFMPKPFSCDQCKYRCKQKYLLAAHKRIHLKVREEPLKCTECSYETTVQWKLTKHTIIKHSDEKPFSCDQCDYRCKLATYLESHKKKHLIEREKPHKCPECSYKTTHMAILRKHIVKHSKEMPLCCDHCDKRFKRKPDLAKHIILQHLKDSEKSYKCNECSYRTIYASMLKTHTKRNHDVGKLFHCDQCNYSCKLKSKIIVHIRTHLKDSDKPYKCAECPYTTVTSKSLRDHTIRMHRNESQFSCDQCNYRCKVKYDLNKHKKIHLKDRDKPHKCTQCSFETFTAVLLKTHTISKHSDEKPLSCDQCGYRSKFKAILDTHKRTHLVNPNKAFKCSECSYETFTGAGLRIHILRKHSVEKPFKCDHCDFRTSTRSRVREHIQAKHICTEDRPFKCLQCPYRATLQSILKYHMIVHNNEKPFACDQCSCRYKRNEDLIIHKKLHIKDCDKPYKCTKCSYITITSTRLRNHIINRHTDKEPITCDHCGYRCKSKRTLAVHIRSHFKKSKKKLI